MTKLLISVKNAHEAMLASQAGANFIDLKDPEVGALGSLNDLDTLAILQAVPKDAAVSATIGDTHDSWQSQIAMIKHKITLGLTLIKLPVSHFIHRIEYQNALKQLTKEHIKLIGVFFADEEVNVSATAWLANLGFYGAMLDTKHKQNHLLSAITTEKLTAFVNLCKFNQLEIGLAGALRLEYIEDLMQYQVGYLGFRSGVCEAGNRKSDLLPHKVQEISEKLCEYNRCNDSSRFQVL